MGVAVNGCQAAVNFSGRSMEQVQYHSEPASSAGAERLFSAAGRAYHDLKGAMNDNSLEHELLALANTD